MNKERVALIILGFMTIVGIYAGYMIGAKNNQQTYETMHSLLKSEINLETIQNLKTLEGLRENKPDTAIEFMQVRVKSALQQEGIEQKTIERAKQYQKKYCESACLGIE